MNAQANDFFTRAEAAASNVYPRLVTLWVMFVALVVMANPS